MPVKWIGRDHQRYRCSMPVSDIDIERQAHLWLQLHGDDAIARAREMVEQMRAKGDEAGADTWLRIIVAIGESRHAADGMRN